MQLILVTGACHGQVQTQEVEIPPDVIYGNFEKDSELGQLRIKYRLVYWSKKEAYYVPFAYRTGYCLKLLLEMKQ